MFWVHCQFIPRWRWINYPLNGLEDRKWLFEYHENTWTLKQRPPSLVCPFNSVSVLPLLKLMTDIQCFSFIHPLTALGHWRKLALDFKVYFFYQKWTVEMFLTCLATQHLYYMLLFIIHHYYYWTGCSNTRTTPVSNTNSVCNNVPSSD